jgi:hypothetical protein
MFTRRYCVLNEGEIKKVEVESLARIPSTTRIQGPIGIQDLFRLSFHWYGYNRPIGRDRILRSSTPATASDPSRRT